MEEYFPLVDETGAVVGKATRRECHSGSFLLHPVVHLHVFDNKGRLYLQKRALNKDIQPGKWDTSVGGHMDPGETVEQALFREAGEELGINEFKPNFLFRYIHRSDVEQELVYSHVTVYEGPINPDPVEIAEGQFWTKEAIFHQLGTGVFTPNFEAEVEQVFKAVEAAKAE
jgi:isopentenyldiphosphate isomerase